VRQNNASAVRSCPNGAGKSGAAFFLEDEDEWGLQAVLQVGWEAAPWGNPDVVYSCFMVATAGQLKLLLAHAFLCA